jgi:hypothetical protein
MKIEPLEQALETYINPRSVTHMQWFGGYTVVHLSDGKSLNDRRELDVVYAAWKEAIHLTNI